uniref:Uncharacterized protein n=1 Tax=Ditylenchus dipsaci TaxID=166011 RepID=A0A915DYU9_9BILA
METAVIEALKEESVDEIEDEDTLHLMLNQQFHSILNTERQLKQLIQEKDSFKNKARLLDQIPIRSDHLMSALSKAIDSSEHMESELSKCRKLLDTFSGKSKTKANKQEMFFHRMNLLLEKNN